MYHYGNPEVVPPVPRRKRSPLSLTEEMESRELPWSHSSDSSMNTGMHTSSSRSSDTSGDAGGRGGGHPGGPGEGSEEGATGRITQEQARVGGSTSLPGSAFSDYVRHRQRSRPLARWQPSMDAFSMASSHTGGSTKSSTFEEVESLDLSGQQEIELRPYFLIQQLSSESGAGPPRHYQRSPLYSSAPEMQSRLREEQDPAMGVSPAGSSTSGSLGHSWHQDGSYRRELVDKLLQYKRQHSNLSDSLSTTSSYAPSSLATSTEQPLRLPFESEYEYRVRRRRMTQSCSSSTPQSSSVGGPLSRTVSLESSSSSFDSSSPSDAIGTIGEGSAGFFGPTAPAEDVLLSMGFGNSDSFLPERFARDWFMKIKQARRDQIQRFRSKEATAAAAAAAAAAAHWQVGSPAGTATGDGSGSRRGSTVELLHQMDIHSRQALHSRRSQLQRAATLKNCQSRVQPLFASQQWGKDNTGYHGPYEGTSPNVEKQDSLEQLKYVLERQSNMLQQQTDSKDRRRRQFASNRQKSLPLHLETLREEDESKARKPQILKGHLKTFFEEEENHWLGSHKDSDPNETKSKRVTGSELRDPLDVEQDQQQSPRLTRGNSEMSESSSVSSYHTSIAASSEILSSEQGDTADVLPTRIEEASSTKPPIIPEIIVSTNRNLPPQTSASLELAEIMQDSQQQRQENSAKLGVDRDCGSAGRGRYGVKRLQPEPAMVTLVLSDLEDSGSESVKSSGSRHSSHSGTGSVIARRGSGGALGGGSAVGGAAGSSNYLKLPSPRHTVSPVPVSPITVIEAEHLDNQSDNMDTSLECDPQGQTVFPEDPNQQHHVTVNGQAITTGPALHPIREELSDQSRSGSFDDSTLSAVRSPAPLDIVQGKNCFDSVRGDDHHFSPILHETARETSESQLSPIALLTEGDQQSRSRVEETRGTDRATVSSTTEAAVVLAERGEQVDDGRLSPIMFNPLGYEAMLQDRHQDGDGWLFCLVSDAGTQCGTPLAVSHLASMTTRTSGNKQTENCATQTPPSMEHLDKPLWHSQVSDEFIPKYVCSVACQTDSVVSGREDSQSENIIFDSGREQETDMAENGNTFLCSHCSKALDISTWSSVSTGLDSIDSTDVEEGKEKRSPQSTLGRRMLDATIDRLTRKTRYIRRRNNGGNIESDDDRTSKLHGSSSSEDTRAIADGAKGKENIPPLVRLIQPGPLSTMENATGGDAPTSEAERTMDSGVGSAREIGSFAEWMQTKRRSVDESAGRKPEVLPTRHLSANDAPYPAPVTVTFSRFTAASAAASTDAPRASKAVGDDGSPAARVSGLNVPPQSSSKRRGTVYPPITPSSSPEQQTDNGSTAIDEQIKKDKIKTESDPIQSQTKGGKRQSRTGSLEVLGHSSRSQGISNEHTVHLATFQTRPSPGWTSRPTDKSKERAAPGTAEYSGGMHETSEEQDQNYQKEGDKHHIAECLGYQQQDTGESPMYKGSTEEVLTDRPSGSPDDSQPSLEEFKDNMQTLARAAKSTPSSVDLKILQEIANDYSVLRAVNSTMDRIFHPRPSLQQLASPNLKDTQDDTPEEISRDTARMREVRAQNSGVAMAANSAMSLSTPNLHLLNPSGFEHSNFDATNQMALAKAEEDRTRLMHELGRLTSAVQKAKCDKQGALTELKAVQEKLRLHRNDVRKMDQTIKENRAKAENARTDLMLLEFKRDSTKKELQRVEEELNRKKKSIEEAGFRSPEQLASILAENEDLKVIAKQTERLKREVHELERQVEAKKESQFNDQKKLRTKIEELEEQHESKVQQIEELSTERDTLQRKLTKLETKCATLEKTKDTILEEKTKDNEQLRENLEEQLNTLRSSSSKDLCDLRTHLNEVTNKLTAAKKEIADKEEEKLKLRERNVELQREVEVGSEKIEAIREESNRNSESIRNNFKREIEEALTSVRIAMEKDKRESLETLEAQLEERHHADLNHLEETLRQQVSSLQGQLTGKEVEIGVLRDRLKQQDEAGKTLGEVLRKDAQQQIQTAVDGERQRAQAERERAIKEAISTALPDHERMLRALREQLGTERDLNEQQSRQLANTKKELEEFRQQNRHLYMDKLSAMNQAKETAQQEKDRQLGQLKDQLEKETGRQLERLRETIEKQEEEIARLRADKMEATQIQQENLSLLERQERLVLQELNEDCHKTAEMLGIPPRRATIPHNWDSTKAETLPGQTPLKTALTTALANLRASHDDIRKHMVELKQEVTNHKLALNQASHSKSHEIENVKQKMTAEKTAALESLKDRLIKEHLQEVGRYTKTFSSEDNLQRSLQEKDHELQEILRNMAHWKEQTAEKLAHKFREEMDRELEKRLKDHRRAEREWERERAANQREMERLERGVQRHLTVSQNGPVTPMARPPLPDTATNKTIQNLQAQLRHLQSENMNLKRASWRIPVANSSSTPDLTSVGVRPSTPTSGLAHYNSVPNSPASVSPLTSGTTSASLGSLGALEERVRNAERRAQMAEGRAGRNEHLLNSKMAELNKAHGTLGHQSRGSMGEYSSLS